MKENGYEADCIIGARSKDLIILEDQIKQYAKNIYITTDDGSYGMAGNVNDCIKYLVNEKGQSYDLIVAIGPKDNDEVCMHTKGAWYKNYSKYESNYGGWYWYVWCM